jgi:hypothetical protein
MPDNASNNEAGPDPRYERAIGERAIAKITDADANQLAANREREPCDRRLIGATGDYEKRIVRLTSGIFVVTAIYAGFSILQWIAMQGTLDQTRVAAQASGNSANAAIAQAITAHQAMLLSERPYVTVGRGSDGRVADWDQDKQGKVTGLIIYFQNAGNTPAFQLYVNLLPTPSALPDKHFAHLTTNWLDGETVAAHSTLDKRVLYFAGKHVGDLFKKVKTGGGQVWQWSNELQGNFEYINVFGEYCCEPFTLSWENHSWSIGGRLLMLVSAQMPQTYAEATARMPWMRC